MRITGWQKLSTGLFVCSATKPPHTLLTQQNTKMQSYKKPFLLFLIATLILSFSTNKQEKKVSVTLTVTEWNTVIESLSKQPYEKANPIINQIFSQAQSQINDTTKIKK